MTKYIFVSEDLYPDLEEKLKLQGQLMKIRANPKSYATVSKHSDIQVLAINEQLYVDEDIVFSDPDQVGELRKIRNTNMMKSQLGDRYPLSVPFNGKFAEDTFIHNLKFSEKKILLKLKADGMKLIHVKQGYTGCSLVLLQGKKGITADKGIYKVLVEKGYDILLIEEGNIDLPGVEYGFIGGCCGINFKDIYINGDLDFHVDGEKIRKFIIELGYQITEVKGEKLKDIGSIIFWEAENE